MSKWRVATNFLDITVKSGDKLFAPTWDLLQKYRTDFDEDFYTKEFLHLMRKSFYYNKDHWKKVLDVEVLTIACYCKHGKFCHRKLLVSVFESACKYFGIEFVYNGELI